MTELHLDLTADPTYLTNPWAFGVNVGSPASLLNPTVQRHLLLGRDELGFRHVRFGGVFDDATGVLGDPGSSGTDGGAGVGGAYDFTALEPALDWLMEQGMSPFVRLTGVPARLAAADGSGRPADPAAWADLAGALAAFVDGRYGCDAQEWHFEVGPIGEPSSADGGGGDGESEAAFDRRYDLTARAIKSVNPRLKVGGPGSADPAVLAAFLDRVARPSETFGIEGQQRCDFVTVDAGAPSAAPSSTAATGGAADDDLPARLAAVRSAATTAVGETVSVYVVGCGRVGPDGSAGNDRCDAAAAAAVAAAGWGDAVAGAIWASMSDADQPAAVARPSAPSDNPSAALQPAALAHQVAHPASVSDAAALRHEPFHGGLGLVTVNDLRKASFNALKLLNEHVGYRVGCQWRNATPGLAVVVSKDYHNMVRVLAAYDPPPAPAQEAQAAGGSDGPKPVATAATPVGSARFSIDGLADQIRYGQVQVIRPSAGSPWEAWARAGHPPFVNRYLLDDLEAAAHPATAEVNFKEYPPRLEPGMVLQLTIPIPDDSEHGYTD